MVGPIWPGLATGIHSLDVVLLNNLIDNSGEMRTCLNYGVRMSFHEWHNRLENVIGVPFRKSLSSTGVVKSVDDLTSADLWHYQPVCDLRLYKFDIVVVDTWTHETVPATVFRDLPDSRYPMKLNHAVQPLLSLIQRKSHCVSWSFVSIMWKGIYTSMANWAFCDFYFCTLEEKNVCVHSCVTCIFIVFYQGNRELNFLYFDI